MLGGEGVRFCVERGGSEVVCIGGKCVNEELGVLTWLSATRTTNMEEM